MKGILKNKDEGELDKVDAHFDRKTVIENTRRNAHLRAAIDSKEEEEEGEGEDKDKSNFEELDHHHHRRSSMSPLRWDEKNLIINEFEKSATMKIDEPKTPYEGGFDPNNDYYREDNEDDGEEGEDGEDGEDDDELVLGEAEDEAEFPPEVIERAEGVEDTSEVKEEEEKEAGEDKKDDTGESAFERMRKMHYKMEAKVRPPEDEEGEDEEGEDDEE